MIFGKICKCPWTLFNQAIKGANQHRDMGLMHLQEADMGKLRW